MAVPENNLYNNRNQRIERGTRSRFEGVFKKNKVEQFAADQAKALITKLEAFLEKNNIKQHQKLMQFFENNLTPDQINKNLWNTHLPVEFYAALSVTLSQKNSLEDLIDQGLGKRFNEEYAKSNVRSFDQNPVTNFFYDLREMYGETLTNNLQDLYWKQKPYHQKLPQRLRAVLVNLENVPVATLKNIIKTSNDSDFVYGAIYLLSFKHNQNVDTLFSDVSMLGGLYQLLGRSINDRHFQKVYGSDLPKIMSHLWDDSTYKFFASKQALPSQIDSLSQKVNIVASVENFSQEYDAYETAPPGTRMGIMSDMLQNAYAGKKNSAESLRFETFIRRSIQVGKQNGGPNEDQRIWFLIHGVASGLLDKNTFKRFNGEFLYDLPLVDFFSDQASWKKDGQMVLPNTPGAIPRPWNENDYQFWAQSLGNNNGTLQPALGFNSSLERFISDTMMQSNAARDRTQQGVQGADKKWDQADAGLVAGFLDSAAVLSLLQQKKNGSDRMTNDFWINFLAEAKFFPARAWRQIQAGQKKYGSDNAEWLKRKKEILNRLITQLKTSMTLVETLTWTEISSGSLPTTMFTNEQWNKKFRSDQPTAKESKNQIEQFVKYLGITKNAPTDLARLEADLARLF